MEQRRHAHDVSLRASDSCLPKSGAAQLSFVPSPDGTVSHRHHGQAHEYPLMPMGASSSELSHSPIIRPAAFVRPLPISLRHA